MHSIVNVSSG